MDSGGWTALCGIPPVSTEWAVAKRIVTGNLSSRRSPLVLLRFLYARTGAGWRGCWARGCSARELERQRFA